MAVQVLDLSARSALRREGRPDSGPVCGPWEGQPLGPKDHILSADEKTSIQARRPLPPALPSAPGRPAHVEHEYERGGALQYLAAWDVRRGYVMGRCEPTTGIAPFGRLVKQVLAEEPYRSADRLFWIVDNGSSHRGDAAKKRLRQVDSRIILVHTPVHASWLNQVEIYFSIIQRKVLTPNDFADLEAVRLRLALYEELSNQNPTPFQWKFDRTKLTALLAKIEARQRRSQMPSSPASRRQHNLDIIYETEHLAQPIAFVPNAMDRFSTKRYYTRHVTNASLGVPCSGMRSSQRYRTRSNLRLERTRGEAACHMRASVAAGRSTAGR